MPALFQWKRENEEELNTTASVELDLTNTKMNTCCSTVAKNNKKDLAANSKNQNEKASGGERDSTYPHYFCKPLILKEDSLKYA